MKSRWFWPVLGSLAVLASSPGLELLTGREVAYSAAVLALLVAFWFTTRLSRRRMGLVGGDVDAYRVAILYPVLVTGLAVAIAYSSGAAAAREVDLGAFIGQILIMAIVTAIGTLLTEDGFFRGWLWGVLEEGRFEKPTVLLWTAAAFALWHLPVPFIEESFRLPATQIPLYTVNVFLLGFNWGILRLASGSVVVPAVSHAVWNGFVYVVFGYGQGEGALGVSSVTVFDPERGWLGVALNGAACWLLWRWQAARSRAEDSEPEKPDQSS